MRQITLAQPGRFTTDDAPEPTRRAGEALVRTRRIGVCGTDLHAFAGRQPFFSYPRVLGHELGVEVVDADDNDQGIQAGDRCCVEPYLNCGRCIACRRGRTNCCEQLEVLGVHIDGGMRPLFTVPIEKLHKSETLSFDQLALVETLGIGAHAVERAAPRRGESALVIGAGPIGLGVIQSLKAADADPIIADVSNERLAFCRDQFAIERAVNPTTGDHAETLRDVNQGELPTLIMDATGHPQSMAATFNLAAHGGRIVFVGLFPGEVCFDDPNFHKRELTLMSSRNATSDTLARLIDRMERGEIDTSPWITHRLTLDEVPTRFGDLPGAAGLIKAMVSVD